MNRTSFLKLLSLLVTFKLSNSAAISYCRTPSGTIGFCSSTVTCKSFVQQYIKFNQQNSPATSFGDYITKSLCGYNGYSFLICCSALDAFYWQPGALFFQFDPISNATTKAPTTATVTTTTTTAAPATTTTTSKPTTTPPRKRYMLPRFETDMCGGINVSTTRVVGGMETRPGVYPWIAALGYRSPPFKIPKFLCAGSLITTRHVLTTAHCLTDELELVRLGAYDLRIIEPTTMDLNIEKRIVHEQYDATSILNDIALLKLQMDVPITSRVRTICIPLDPTLRNNNLNGLVPTVAGWGAIAFQGPTSDVLKDVQVPVVDLKTCADRYKSRFPNVNLGNRVVCAGYEQGGKDACQGDSGGPLMLSWPTSDKMYYYYNLVGIVSYGYECARADFPGIYTRISNYIPWIESKLNV